MYFLTGKKYQISYFLIILLHFTIVCAFEVIYVCHMCVMEILYQGPLMGTSYRLRVSLVSLAARNQPCGNIYTTELNKRHPNPSPLLSVLCQHTLPLSLYRDLHRSL